MRLSAQSESTQPLDPEVAEKYTIQMPDEKWHGTSGPIAKSYPKHFNHLHTVITTSMDNAGLPLNSEPVSGESAPEIYVRG